MPLNDFRSVCLPYCLKKIENEKYVVLNREYKPLGFKTREHIVYEDYPIMIRFKRLTSEMIRKISCDGNPDKKEIFLYNDGCIPTVSQENMNNYLKRLELLSKLKLEE